MSIDKDWRFAELIVRSWTEPDLAARYQADPYHVLAEAGIHPAPGETPPALPALPAHEELEVVIDLFTGPASHTSTQGPHPYTKNTATALFCFSICDTTPTPPHPTTHTHAGAGAPAA
ncbi:hypothetical protein [Kitasatospora sp. MAP5-34]|uniref:hypothetical protein n=1 Tax=Kitasatospora sp. MAP5-34 TaxID=3035102 RepID=UPI00247622E2|nr:hypothetical protein [Kitasatospora sp. MAP5-34]MDH6580681.1 putative thiazole/oxazole-modified microcin (TOMM)-like peptide [Kitasatospora sp. MAP5-34]